MTHPTNDEPGYAAALAELEAILGELERPDVDVDVLAQKVERAAVLIRLCRARITSAQVQIEQVLVDLDAPLTAPPTS